MAMLRIGEEVRPALVARVIAVFMGSTPAILDQLSRSLARGDADALQRAAHSLKSSASSVGAVALADLAQWVELHARAGMVGLVKEKLTEIQSLFDEAIAELEALRRDLAPDLPDASGTGPIADTQPAPSGTKT